MPLTNEAMRHIADSLNADYVLGYRNLYTVSTDSGLIIKLTTMLYARADQAILLEKETIGDLAEIRKTAARLNRIMEKRTDAIALYDFLNLKGFKIQNKKSSEYFDDYYSIWVCPSFQVRFVHNWYVWKINDKDFTRAGKLEGAYRQAEIGLVINPADIVNRMRTGQYAFQGYPGF